MTVYAVLLLAFALACLDPPPPHEPIEKGYLTRYSIGVMRRVTLKRGLLWTGCGMAIDNQPMGSFVLVRGVKTGVERVCQVVDYSGPKDRARHIKAHLLEIDSVNQEEVCGKEDALSGWRQCPVLIRRNMPPVKPTRSNRAS